MKRDAYLELLLNLASPGEVASANDTIWKVMEDLQRHGALLRISDHAYTIPD
jgi:hypothetical protein